MKWFLSSRMLLYFNILLMGSSASWVKAAENEPKQDSEALRVEPLNQHYDALFNKAVQLLDTMKSSPSCNRIAATKLVASCQVLGGKSKVDSHSNEELEYTRSIYAARLAICELDDAGVTVPIQCLQLTVSPPPLPKTLFGFARKPKTAETDPGIIPKELVEQCLKALESRPQSWTSYSNSRQNALVICQAAQIENEKEELLNLHRSIVESSFKLSDGLQLALQRAAEEASRNEAFMQTVQALQENLSVDLRETESLLKATFKRFLHEIEVGFQAVVNGTAITWTHMNEEAASIGKEIRNASQQIGDLQKILQDVHEQTISRKQEVIREHEQSAIVNRDLALGLQSSLESLVDKDLLRVSQGVAAFDVSLEWLMGRLTLILEQEHRMMERLRTMEASMEQSEHRANELQKAQHLQAEALAAQARAQTEIQFRSQLSQALLEKTAVTAANLQTALEGAALKARQIPALHFGNLRFWALYLILLALVGQYSRQAAILLSILIIGQYGAALVLQNL